MTTYVLRYDGDGKPRMVDKRTLNDVDDKQDLHYVQPDLPDYESPIDGRIVNGRRARRNDLRRSGSREYEGRESEMRAVKERRRDRERALDRAIVDTCRWINA